MKSKLVLLSGAFALAMSGGAIAQQMSGFYGGGGLGKSEIKLDRGDFAADAPIGATFDQKDTAWKIFAGYRFTPNFAAELSYNDFGKAEARFSVPAGALGVGVPATAGTARLDYKASSWALWGVGMAPFAQRFSVLGKLGLARNEARRGSVSANFTDPGGDFTFPGAKQTKTRLAWGVGAQYDFSPRVGLRLEYEDFGKFGKAFSDDSETSGRAKVNMWSLNIIGRF